MQEKSKKSLQNKKWYCRFVASRKGSKHYFGVGILSGTEIFKRKASKSFADKKISETFATALGYKAVKKDKKLWGRRSSVRYRFGQKKLIETAG